MGSSSTGSFRPFRAGGGTDDVVPYVGSLACRTCHAKEYFQWKSTPHSSALQPFAPHTGAASRMRQLSRDWVRVYNRVPNEWI